MQFGDVSFPDLGGGAERDGVDQRRSDMLADRLRLAGAATAELSANITIAQHDDLSIQLRISSPDGRMNGILITQERDDPRFVQTVMSRLQHGGAAVPGDVSLDEIQHYIDPIGRSTARQHARVAYLYSDRNDIETQALARYRLHALPSLNNIFIDEIGFVL